MIYIFYILYKIREEGRHEPHLKSIFYALPSPPNENEFVSKMGAFNGRLRPRLLQDLWTTENLFRNLTFQNLARGQSYSLGQGRGRDATMETGD